MLSVLAKQEYLSRLAAWLASDSELASQVAKLQSCADRRCAGLLVYPLEDTLQLRDGVYSLVLTIRACLLVGGDAPQPYSGVGPGRPGLVVQHKLMRLDEQSALRQQELALITIPAIVTVLLMDGRVVYQNPRSQRYLGNLVTGFSPQPGASLAALAACGHPLQALFRFDAEALVAFEEAMAQEMLGHAGGASGVERGLRLQVIGSIPTQPQQSHHLQIPIRVDTPVQMQAPRHRSDGTSHLYDAAGTVTGTVTPSGTAESIIMFSESTGVAPGLGPDSSSAAGVIRGPVEAMPTSSTGLRRTASVGARPTEPGIGSPRQHHRPGGPGCSDGSGIASPATGGGALEPPVRDSMVAEVPLTVDHVVLALYPGGQESADGLGHGKADGPVKPAGGAAAQLPAHVPGAVSSSVTSALPQPTVGATVLPFLSQPAPYSGSPRRDTGPTAATLAAGASETDLRSVFAPVHRAGPLLSAIIEEGCSSSIPTDAGLGDSAGGGGRPAADGRLPQPEYLLSLMPLPSEAVWSAYSEAHSSSGSGHHRELQGDSGAAAAAAAAALDAIGDTDSGEAAGDSSSVSRSLLLAAIGNSGGGLEQRTAGRAAMCLPSLNLGMASGETSASDLQILSRTGDGGEVVTTLDLERLLMGSRVGHTDLSSQGTAVFSGVDSTAGSARSRTAVGGGGEARTSAGGEMPGEAAVVLMHHTWAAGERPRDVGLAVAEVSATVNGVMGGGGGAAAGQRSSLPGSASITVGDNPLFGLPAVPVREPVGDPAVSASLAGGGAPSRMSTGGPSGSANGMVAAQDVVNRTGSGSVRGRRHNTTKDRLTRLLTSVTPTDSDDDEGGDDTEWHDVYATVRRDGPAGRVLVVITQTVVTEQVEAQRKLEALLEHEHKVLESIFPRHVIEHMTVQVKGRSAALGGGPGAGQLASSFAHFRGSAMEALATSHRCVTVLFCDIIGFTEMCKQVSAMVVMRFLNTLYMRFDELIDIYGVYKVETIGDCYMVAGGLVRTDGEGNKTVIDDGSEDALHAVRVMSFAKAVMREAAEVLLPTTGEPVQLRIGLHSGPVMSGIVGDKMPRFCLFGDTVNTASRMESTCPPGAIHVSSDTRALLSNEAWTPSGGVFVKGKGVLETYVWAGHGAEEDEETERRLKVYL
ncbi:hypothetical protein GPECTOR_8g145 [Gonium pectorale]|uniref:Guanylate cyclase domain-containing protein n=1 Tax=Gonium pectorale TaxID=33097 RepID=A0A150GSK4_GONPE|nr:hypothetical protein GPECTOR_8g145 [Gonium pectorale]|eukprot:KXZ52754.1 hypothetical protein GPECTOR_8g145 [Gonium pectorale]